MQLRATRLTAIASAVKRAIKAFSPAQLFGTGAPGVWYDPSDYTTLFQDSAGTTPVTAVEQPVGLMLDKSQGLVLGSELVTNGDFSNGTTGWTELTPTFSVSSGVGVLSGANSTVDSALFSTVIGKSYQFTITNLTAGGQLYYKVRRGDTNANLIDTGSVSETAGVKTFVFTALSSTTYLRFNRGGTAGSTSFDNISVKELPGNHAFQSTSASRPVLSARYNLFTRTEDFSNAAWVKSASPAVTLTNQGDGVWRLQAAAGAWLLYQILPQAAGVNCTVSFEVRSNGTGADTFRLMLQGSIFTSNQTATNEWVRYSHTNTNAGSGSTGIIQSSSATAIDVLIRFPSLVVTSQAPTAYQRVNTSTDYATTGFLPYLKFDGVDDSLSTNSINFTSTDKMSVFAGVRKLSDAANAALVELSAVSTTNAGTFAVFAPATSNTSNVSWRSRGTVLPASNAIATGISSPTSFVLTGVGDIAADIESIRINSIAIQTVSDDQGTGNYDNYPLYIGRRNNASLPFNGQLYSMIIVGKAVQAGELSSAEAYVNSKTKAY